MQATFLTFYGSVLLYFCNSVDLLCLLSFLRCCQKPKTSNIIFKAHKFIYKTSKKWKHISDFETNTQHKLPIQVLFSWKCLLNFWSSRLCIRGRAWRWKRSRDLLPAGCCIHADPHSPHPSSATISPAPSIFLPRPLLRSHLLFYWFFCLF